MAKIIQFYWQGAGWNGPTRTEGPFSPAGPWQPPMNAYLCEQSIRVCFDLAGVDKAQIDIQIEPGRLVVRGVRKPPEPSSCPKRILAMEIDHGPFLRELRLPSEIRNDEVTAEQRDGLLWINLPLRHE